MMIGSSGATVRHTGDVVTKYCRNAQDQAHWMRTASALGVVDGIAVVQVIREANDSYVMEYVLGKTATHEPSVVPISNLYRQVKAWSVILPQSNASWTDYLLRLKGHAEIAHSDIIDRAVRLISASQPLQQSFCHGDLTLENAIVAHDGTTFLIDPNADDSIYQSWLLDCGKLLQSTHTDYHLSFKSNNGVPLARHDAVLCAMLRKDGIYREALIACLSHIVRLCKYRINEMHKIESIAIDILKELEC